MRANCMSGGNGGSALATGPFYPLACGAAALEEDREWLEHKESKEMLRLPSMTPSSIQPNSGFEVE